MAGIWCSMYNIKEETRLICLSLISSLSVGLVLALVACQACIFLNTSSRIGFKSDLFPFITGWWGFYWDVQRKIAVYHKTMSVKNQIWQWEQPSPAFSKSFPVTWILISNKLSMWDLNEYKNMQIPNIKSSTILGDKVKANVWNIWIGLVQYKWKDSKFWVFSVEDKVKEAQMIALQKMLSLTYVSASHQESCSLRGALCGTASPSTESHHHSREGPQGQRSLKEG